MGKVIAKTAMQIISIILLVAVIALLVLHFLFPQTMATFNEKIGNYTLATEYAAKYYERNGGADNLARCVDDAILSGNDGYIVKYGDKLISHEEFERVCTEKDARFSSISLDYKQYVCGNVAVSKYNLRDFNGAIQLALTANGTTSFKNNNALIILSAKIASTKDEVCAFEMLTVLASVSPNTSEDADRLTQVKSILTNIGD